MRTTGLGVTAIALLVLSGCGGGKADNAPASVAAADIDPCSLITAAEVAAITTDAVGETRRQQQTCKYVDASGEGVEVTIKPNGKDEMATMHRVAGVLGGMGAGVADKGGAGADTAALLKQDKAAPPKLGDEAMWGPNTTLAIRKGDTYVEVSPPLIHDMATHKGMPIIDKAEKQKIAVTVAEKVLAKLPG